MPLKNLLNNRVLRVRSVFQLLCENEAAPIVSRDEFSQGDASRLQQKRGEAFKRGREVFDALRIPRIEGRRLNCELPRSETLSSQNRDFYGDTSSLACHARDHSEFRLPETEIRAQALETEVRDATSNVGGGLVARGNINLRETRAFNEIHGHFCRRRTSGDPREPSAFKRLCNFTPWQAMTVPWRIRMSVCGCSALETRRFQTFRGTITSVITYIAYSNFAIKCLQRIKIPKD